MLKINLRLLVQQNEMMGCMKLRPRLDFIAVLVHFYGFDLQIFMHIWSVVAN